MELFDQPQNNQCVTIIVFRALSQICKVKFAEKLRLVAELERCIRHGQRPPAKGGVSDLVFGLLLSPSLE